MTKKHSLEGEKTVQLTLFTARLISGFWDRWRGHGVKDDLIKELVASLKHLEEWVSFWEKQAYHTMKQGKRYAERKQYREAESCYRLSALYYNLNQWIYPERNEEKINWFIKCIEMVQRADELSAIETVIDLVKVEGKNCHGRIRIPPHPIGCVIIINPLDSSKEELFTYEADFVDGGFVTMSYDGPGQGTTFTFEGLKGTENRWKQFVDQIIERAKNLFPQLPLHLFGTSSGAAWSIYGSQHAEITSSVAVSPAIVSSDIQLPDYFLRRMSTIVEKDETVILHLEPSFDMKPIFLFHGLKDVLVPTQAIKKLYDVLPQGKKYLEYEKEGHCCNYKLDEIRKLSMEWYSSKTAMRSL